MSCGSTFGATRASGAGRQTWVESYHACECDPGGGEFKGKEVGGIPRSSWRSRGRPGAVFGKQGLQAELGGLASAVGLGIRGGGGGMRKMVPPVPINGVEKSRRGG